MSYSPDMSATHEYSPHQYGVLTPEEAATLEGEARAFRTVLERIEALPASQRRATGVLQVLNAIEHEMARIAEPLDNHLSTPRVSDEYALSS